MRKKLFAVLGLALFSTVALAQEGSVSDEGASDCAWNRRFDTWSYVDDKTIILSYSPNHKFEITFNARCHDLRNALAVALKSSGSCVRPGDHIVVDRRGWGPEICVISEIEPYTNESSQSREESGDDDSD